MNSCGILRSRWGFLGRRLRSQIVRSDLDQASARTEPPEGNRWIGSRPHHDVGTGGQVLQEVAELLVDRGRLDDVDVVKDEYDVGYALYGRSGGWMDDVGIRCRQAVQECRDGCVHRSL